MSAAQMRRQLEQLAQEDEHVQIDSWSPSEFEVTVFYFGSEGPTHFHVQGKTLPEAVDRAFRTRAEMKAHAASSGSSGST
jgi:hypothetical protein